MSEKKFLKQKKEKRKMEPKLISQKKINFFFIGVFSLVIALAVGTIVVNATKTFIPRTSEKVVKQTKLQPKDNRLDIFLSSYIKAYFSYDGKNVTEYQEKLNYYYATAPVIKSQGQRLVYMELSWLRLCYVKDNIAYYQVSYYSGAQQKQQKTILFCVPYVEKDGKFYVKSLPSFRALETLKLSSKGEMLQLESSDGYDEDEKKPLIAFLKLFFENYTTSQENLDIVSKGVKAVPAMTYKSMDYTYFVKDGNTIKAYVQATFELADNTHSENFTFTITKKGKSFYVEKLEYSIPSNYSKRQSSEG